LQEQIIMKASPASRPYTSWKVTVPQICIGISSQPSIHER
jgi:hypothetical protein